MKNGIYYCSRYNSNEIAEIFEKNIKKYISSEKIFSNSKILLKPNLLSPKSPVNNITTHPSVIEGIIIYLKNFNTQISLGDSPSAPVTDYNNLIQKTEMASLLNKYSIKLESFQNYKINKYSFMNKDIYLSSVINEYDYIINIPKFKTHTLTTITGAVKNLFGFIPGMLKVDFHNNFDEMIVFAKALLYIANIIEPKIILNVMDAVEAMEGDGPSSGDTIVLNSIIVGNSIYGVDLTAAQLTGIKTDDIPFLKLAQEQGYYDINKLEIIDNEIKEIKKIKLPMQNILVKILPYQLFKIASKLCRIKPVILNDKCKKCYMCIKICSKKCITKKENGSPEIKYKNCIQCFCCSEVCPYKSIILKDNYLIKIYKMASKIKKPITLYIIIFILLGLDGFAD